MQEGGDVGEAPATPGGPARDVDGGGEPPRGLALRPTPWEGQGPLPAGQPPLAIWGIPPPWPLEGQGIGAEESRHGMGAEESTHGVKESNDGMGHAPGSGFGSSSTKEGDEEYVLAESERP